MHIEIKSPLYWSVIGLVVIFLFAAPFPKALFDGNAVSLEYPLYVALAWSAGALFLTSLVWFKHWNLYGKGDALHVVVWFIPLSYLVSLPFAVSHHTAVHSVYMHTMYAAFFIIGMSLANHKLSFSLLRNGVMFSGYAVVWYGLLHLFGNAHRADAVILQAGQVRLASVFEYPNTYAAYLTGILLGGLFLVVSSRKWYAAALHAMMLAPAAISFLLTLSRGGLLAFPVSLWLLLPFLTLARQIALLLCLAVTFAVSLFTLGKISGLGLEIYQRFSAPLSFAGWTTLLSASAAAAVAVLLVKRYVLPALENIIDKYVTFRYSRMLLPAGMIIAGLLGGYVLFGHSGVVGLLPDNIKHRIESINLQQHSVLERATFYKDALKLFRDYPLFGAGGGAWPALYQTYQSNPYVSTQTHNFYLQYLVETGLAGFAALIVFLGYVFFRFMRNVVKNSAYQRETDLVFYIFAVSVLIHSIIDFNMSYAYLSSLVFLCLGAMASRGGFPEYPPSGEAVRKIYGKTYAVFLCLIAVGTYAASLQTLYANYLFNAAVHLAEEDKPLREVFAPLDEALAKQPDHPDSVLYKVGLLYEAYGQTKNEAYHNEALERIGRLKKQEPFDRRLLEAEYDAYMDKEQFDRALTVVSGGLKHFPWDISLYERSITLHYELGNKARLDGNKRLADSHWNAAFDIYGDVLQKIEQLKRVPKTQRTGRPFYVTPYIAYSLGKIYFIRGDFESAAAMLKPDDGESLDDPLNRMTVRWYIAALRKQNKDDPEWYEKLLAADPNEKMAVDALLQSDTEKNSGI